jgi:VWFA-related protein
VPPPQIAGRTAEREDVRRTIAIVVSDIGLGFPELVQAREAVKTFVTEYLHEGDLVSIMSTSGGMGVYAQFTTDREILKTAANSLRWIADPRTISRTQPPGEARMFQAAPSGAVVQALDVMRSMPGRKSIVLLSGGGYSQPREDELERLADAAARSAVSVYPIDVRGVTISGGAEQMFQQAGMEYLAKRTGGVFHGDNDNQGRTGAGAER